MKRHLLIALLLIARFAGAVESKVEPKILYEEDPTLLTSTIEVVVLTGSADDPAGKNGLTNLLSELILRGTKKKSRNAFQSEIERMGASISVRTSHDMIVFVGRVIKENTHKFLALLSDALLKPKLDPKEFNALKTEILAEISHMKNSNGRLSGLAMRKELLGGTILERPVQGSLKTVKSISRDDVLRAYNNQFNRANFVFAIAAPLKEEELKKPLTDLWLGFPDGARRVRHSVPPHVPARPTLVLVHKPKTSTGSVMFGQAGITAGDPTRYPLSVGNFAFGGEPLVSRLFRKVRSELGWTYAIGSTYHAMGGLSFQQGFYIISSTPSVEFTTKAILKILAMWDEFKEKGLDKNEISLARDSLINSYPFEFDSAEKRLWQRLHSYIYNVPLLSPEEYAKTIGSIDNKKIVQALAEKQAGQGWIIAVVADRDIIEKQLAEEQKALPEDKRIVISRQLSPEELVQ